MADVALFTFGFLAGTYIGLVCKKNNIFIIPRTMDLGKFGGKGDIDKEYQVMKERYLAEVNLLPNNTRHREQYNR